MSYTRTAIATAVIVTSLATAGSVTQPASAAAGLAEATPQDNSAHSHRPSLQAPEVIEERIESHVIHAETDELHAMAEAVLAEMADAGLTLPPVVIHLHSDQVGCSSDPDRLINGYHAEIDGQHVVHSCGNRWTLLHELGHVWDDEHLDDETRNEILSHQGIESWHAGSWKDSGAEHIASIIAWAVDGTRPTRIGRYADSHLAEAYQMATGMDLPGTAVNEDVPQEPAVAVTTADLPATELA